MLGIIIRREILEYITSSKWIISLSVTVLLVVTSTWINIGEFRQRNQDYLDAREEMKSDKYRVQVYRPPQVLSILVQGKDRKLGNRLEMTYHAIPQRPTGYMGFASQHDRYFSGYAAVDFAFIIRVVMSLMVIFLAYNAVSEEKTQGTLKLALANHVPRDQLMIGKYLGGMIVVLGSLAVATLSALLIMIFHPAVALTGNDWLRILAVLSVSVLYLSVFFALSLFVSIAANRPSSSLMILLQLWIFLIVIIPNLSVLAARQSRVLPNDQEIAAQKEAAFQPYQAEYERIDTETSVFYSKGESPPDDLGLKKLNLDILRTELSHRIDLEYSRRQTRQLSLARALSVLSPAALFDQAAQHFARTDIEEYEQFMNGVDRYWSRYIEMRRLVYTDIEAFRSAALPEFSGSETPLRDLFYGTLLQWLMLFLICTLFITLGFVMFLRKDVR